MSDRYIQDRFLPDKAIDVIDEAGARMRIRNMMLPQELRDLDDKLRESAPRRTRPSARRISSRPRRLRDQEKQLEAQRDEAEKAWRKQMEGNA